MLNQDCDRSLLVLTWSRWDTYCRRWDTSCISHRDDASDCSPLHDDPSSAHILHTDVRIPNAKVNWVFLRCAHTEDVPLEWTLPIYQWKYQQFPTGRLMHVEMLLLLVLPSWRTRMFQGYVQIQWMLIAQGLSETVLQSTWSYNKKLSTPCHDGHEVTTVRQENLPATLVHPHAQPLHLQQHVEHPFLLAYFNVRKVKLWAIQTVGHTTCHYVSFLMDGCSVECLNLVLAVPNMLLIHLNA